MTTTTEIYLKSEEITNVQQTVSDMLDRLATETKQQGADNYCQVVIQLNEDAHTDKECKIFVYDNIEKDTYTYSYQDEDMWDTAFYKCVTRDFMLAKTLEEIKAVGGLQWIAIDF